jgi:hypothetical protein
MEHIYFGSYIFNDPALKGVEAQLEEGGKYKGIEEKLESLPKNSFSTW